MGQPLDPIPVTQGQMNLILTAVEHGFREHERGKNLEGALAGVFQLYRVAAVAGDRGNE